MSISENITCTSAYNSLGCSFPLLGSYTGNEREVTPLSTKKSLSRVKAKNSMFLYSLLKSAASAVLKLTSAVIAIAHVRSVSMKSLSVMTILFE